MKIEYLFARILQRAPDEPEVERVRRFVDQQQRFFRDATARDPISSPWPLAAQALLMSNEFAYVD